MNGRCVPSLLLLLFPALTTNVTSHMSLDSSDHWAWIAGRSRARTSGFDGSLSPRPLAPRRDASARPAPLRLHLFLVQKCYPDCGVQVGESNESRYMEEGEILIFY